MFDIGQKIVCINDNFEDLVGTPNGPVPLKTLYTQLPVKNQTYVVRDVRAGVNAKGQGKESLLLVGLNNPPCEKNGQPRPLTPMTERGFDGDRFRPLDALKEEWRVAEKDAIAKELPAQIERPTGSIVFV
jgi:hypothetical protein